MKKGSIVKGSVGAQKWLVHALLTILVRTIIDAPNPSDGALDFFHDPSRSSTTSHYVEAINAVEYHLQLTRAQPFHLDAETWKRPTRKKNETAERPCVKWSLWGEVCFGISGSSWHVPFHFLVTHPLRLKHLRLLHQGIHRGEQCAALLACKVMRQKDSILARPAPREQWPCCFVSQISPSIVG